MLAQLHHDPAPAHLVRHCARRAGACKRVENQVPGIGPDMYDALK